jgi:hypothetical protein
MLIFHNVHAAAKNQVVHILSPYADVFVLAMRRLPQLRPHPCLINRIGSKHKTTTRCAVSLFFLCVKTNINYTVVETFITQIKDSSSIAETLQLLLNHLSPVWTLHFFMVDYCEVEMNALEQAFSGMLKWSCTSCY